MKENILTQFRIGSAVLSFALALSILLTGTLSWINFGQLASNELRGEEESEVYLLKLEMDEDGVLTGNEVPGAEFYLFREDTPDDVQVNGRFVTDSDGLITVFGLEPGDYYFLETRPAPGYIFDLDSGGQPVTRYEFTYTGVAPADGIVVTAYNRLIDSSLSIRKQLENADGSSLTSDQLDEEFEFIVEIDGMPDGTISVDIDGVTGQFIVSGSVFTIKLKHGQTATLNLPVGTAYSIIETRKAEYIISSVNHAGNVPEEGVEAVFTNTYSPDAYDGTLTVSKQVFDMSTGGTLPANSDFDFTISFLGSYVPDPIQYSINGGPVQNLPADGKFTLGHLDSITFLNIPAGLTYTVAEYDYSAMNFITNPWMYNGITTNGDIILPFNNYYYDDIEEPKDPGSLEITKMVTGENLETEDYDRLFSFIVDFEGDDLPDPIQYSIDGGPTLQLAADGEIQLKHGQKALFGNLPFNTKYTVIEQAEAMYTPVVWATSGFIAELATAYAVFINEKNHGMPDPDAIITIQKVVVGEVSDQYLDKEFEFTLFINGTVFSEFTLKDGESVTYSDIPAGSTYEVVEEDYSGEGFLRSITNGWGTVISDETIEVVQTNTFVADVEATIAGEKTWDLKGHTPTLPGSITVYLRDGDTLIATSTVTPDSDDRWLYSWNVPKYRPDGITEIVYTVTEAPIESWWPSITGYDILNTYIPPVILDDDPPVRKIITGDTPPVDAVFWFTMTGLAGAPMPDGYEISSNSKTISVVGAGDNEFGDMVFTRAGTYVYTIVEINTGETGYAYDNGVYTLTIVIVEESNALVMQSRTLTRDGVLSGVALFTNNYNGSQADMVNISGAKTWNHGANTPANYPGSITVLVRANGNIIIQRVVTASDNWAWSFVLDRYDTSGNEIVYTIDESTVPNYNKQVSGYNIINTYNPGSGPGPGPGDPGDPGNPGNPGGKPSNTGDDNDVLLWIAAIILSSYCMIILIIERRRRSRYKVRL